MIFKSYKNGNEVIVVFQCPEDAVNVVTEVLKNMYDVDTPSVPAIKPPVKVEDTPPSLEEESVVPLFVQEDTEVKETESVEEKSSENQAESVIEENTVAPKEKSSYELITAIFKHNKGLGNRIINEFWQTHKYDSFFLFRYNISYEHAKELYNKMVSAGVIPREV